MTTLSTTRVTVDLPSDDYASLRIAAAQAGKGESMASLIRQLVRAYLDAEAAEDAADIAIARARVGSGGKVYTTDEMHTQLADIL